MQIKKTSVLEEFERAEKNFIEVKNAFCDARGAYRNPNLGDE